MKRNITVSLDEAVGLLSKWQTERTKVSVVFAVKGAAFGFDGFIAHLAADNLVIAHVAVPADNVLMGLSEAMTFRYMETRRQTYIACLTIESEAWKCFVYEIPDEVT